jgi:hypothetical protein
VCGNSPARSRIAAGMVTCPFDVMRMADPLLLNSRVSLMRFVPAPGRAGLDDQWH